MTAARIGIDMAGSNIIGPGVPKVTVMGVPIAVVGDQVAGHGLPPHTAPILVGGSSKVFANGIPVIRAGIDMASCGHVVVSTQNKVTVV